MFDIVFLDIQMDGINGIEAERVLRKRQEETVLIFITRIKEYVFDALDLYAFQYLLKPLDENKFSEVLDRAVKEAGRKKGKRGLFIKARNLTLDTADILYIESRGKKVEIHTAKESIEIYGTMEELEEQLGTGFYRCHRAYIVNMAHITEYGSDSIRITSGDSVYLAKKKYSEFVKAYMWYLQNGEYPVFEMADIIFSMCFYLFQGYCLQYFYGSFLESRIKDRRWNSLVVVASHMVFRMALSWIWPSKNWDYRTGAWKMAPVTMHVVCSGRLLL